MTSDVLRKVLCVRPQGILWVGQSGEDTCVSFPGPLKTREWQFFAELNHPQIGKVFTQGENFESGALVSFAPKSGNLRDERSGKELLSDLRGLEDYLLEQGLPTDMEVWAKTFEVRTAPVFFVCVPFNMAGEEGWAKLEFTVGRSLSRSVRTKRLPIHKRVRFRVGAAGVVTAVTLLALVTFWPLQMEAAERRLCPAMAEVKTQLEGLLLTRAEALENGNIELLGEIESEELLKADEAMIQEREEGEIVAPSYSVEILSHECESETVRVNAQIISFIPDITNQDQNNGSQTKDAIITLGHNPWKILEFEALYGTIHTSRDPNREDG